MRQDSLWVAVCLTLLVSVVAKSGTASAATHGGSPLHDATARAPGSPVYEFDELLPGAWQSPKRLALYAAPAASSPTIGAVTAGEAVKAVGKVHGTSWYGVQRKGRLVFFQMAENGPTLRLVQKDATQSVPALLGTELCPVDFGDSQPQ